MSIFNAINIGVAGSSAQSFALSNVSGNIANAQTIGFKGVDTVFESMILENTHDLEQSGSVRPVSRNTANVQGELVSSSTTTNMAISGDGFFIVKDLAGQTSPKQLYSRRGDFELNKDGYLVNKSGHYLQGYTIDPSTSITKNSVLSSIQLPLGNIPAKITTKIDYQANLPRSPQTSNADASVAGSELLPATLNTATISATNETSFLSNTIAGQSVTTYDAAGSPINVQMRWGKTSNTTPETWSLYYLSNSSATGAATKWTQVSGGVQFSAAGQLSSPASGIISSTFTVNGASTGAINLNFGTAGLTQYADSSGQISPSLINQDGYSTGTLNSVTVDDAGKIVGNYSNGRLIALADVPLARFASPNQLRRNQDGAFERTSESGDPLIVSGSNMVKGSTLENSNVDIGSEFSKMIVGQQVYGACNNTIRVGKEMMQDLVSLVR